MRKLRLLILALTAILVFALAAFALVQQMPFAPGDDDIIIKGGSLDVECGKNQGADCFGGNDAGRKPKHRNQNGKIVQIVVRRSNGTSIRTFTMRDDFPDGKPQVQITYRVPRPEDN